MEYKKSEPTTQAAVCHTCTHRPKSITYGNQFLCTAIHKIMRDSDKCGCRNWKVRKE